MSVPLISCIIPVWNGERYIADAIASIIAQSYVNTDIIIVDDGSTDGTAEAVEGFGARVRYIRQENAGPAAARNKGINAARGELLAFLDSDDMWEPDRLALQYADLVAPPAVDVSVCLIQNFFESGFEPATDFERSHPKNGPMPGYVSTGILLSKETMNRVGGFNESLSHGDGAEWFVRARRLGVTDRVFPRILVHRRIHGNNRSRLRANASRDEFLSIIKSSLDKRREERQV